MTREEIIEGLMGIHAVTANYKGDQVILHSMPMKKLTEILYGAAELLKAQEPRVTTLEEAAEADYCYVEFQNGNIKPALIRCFDVGVFKLQLKDTYHIIGPDFVKLYGRCWTSRPTDKQREATPWKAAPCGTPGDEMRRKAEWGIKH